MRTIACPATPLTAPAWEKIDAARVVSGTPQSAYQVLHTNAGGNFYAGIYEASAGAWKVSYAEDEFCTLIEGHVRLTNEAGESDDYRAPQSFIIPEGFKGTWECVTPVRKFFAICEN